MSMLASSSQISISTSIIITSTSSPSSVLTTGHSTPAQQLSPSSESTTNSTPSPVPSTSPPRRFFDFNPAYLFPIVGLAGIILGASCAAVIIRPWAHKRRQRSPKPGGHPFPEDGGLMPFPSPLDEEEKRWIASKSSYSDDAYHTVDESDEEMAQKPQSRLLSPSVADETEYDVTSSRSIYEPYWELDEVDLYAQSNGIDRPSVSTRLRQSMQQRAGESSKIVPEKTSVVIRPSAHPMLSPTSTNVFSPPLMKDLFFLDGASHACSRDAWGTAESVLGNGDSEEEANLQGVIMSAGSSHGATQPAPSSDNSYSNRNPVRIPPSLSTLSTTVRARRLVRSIPMRPIGLQPHTSHDKDAMSAATATKASWERGEEQQGPSTDQSRPWSDAHDSHSAALQTVAGIIRSQWSQRALSAEVTSPTLFGASLSSYTSEDVHHDVRRPRFGVAKRI